MICPAYQSMYILDDSIRFAFYSYVWQLDENTRTQFITQIDTDDNINDTITAKVIQQPKTDYYAYASEKVVPWKVPARTKYGIIKPVFMPIKKYRMQTAPMENVLGPKPISDDFVAKDFEDSRAIDSLSLASADSLAITPLVQDNSEEKKETRFLYGYNLSDNFNVEQFYYNKYYADRLIDHRPEPEPQPESVASQDLSTDSAQTKKPFFRGLFKKKKKKEIPNSEDENQSTDEMIDSQSGETEE